MLVKTKKTLYNMNLSLSIITSILCVLIVYFILRINKYDSWMFTSITFIFFTILAVVASIITYRLILGNQTLNVFPTINCKEELLENYYIWVPMYFKGNKLTDLDYHKWANKLLISGPNIIGISENRKNLSNLDLEEDFKLFKQVFRYSPEIIRGKYLTKDNINYCKKRKVRYVSMAFDLFRPIWNCNL